MEQEEDTRVLIAHFKDCITGIIYLRVFLKLLPKEKR